MNLGIFWTEAVIMHNALTRTKFTYSTKLTYSENPDKWYR